MSLCRWLVPVAGLVLLTACAAEPDVCTPLPGAGTATVVDDSLPVDVSTVDATVVDVDEVNAYLTDKNGDPPGSRYTELERQTLLNAGAIDETDVNCEPSDAEGLVDCVVDYGDLQVEYQVNVVGGDEVTTFYDYTAMTGVLRAETVYAQFRQDFPADAQPRCDELPEPQVVDTVEPTGYQCGALRDDGCGALKRWTFDVVVDSEGAVDFWDPEQE